MADDTLFLYVKIPGSMQPIERGERFEAPLLDALEAEGVGEVTGGGTMMGDDDPYCGIDVELTDVERGLAIVRETLRRCGAPRGTRLQYTLGEDDERDEDLWAS